MPLIQKPVAQMRSQKTRATSYQNTFSTVI
jgi:hypothetical protein